MYVCVRCHAAVYFKYIACLCYTKRLLVLISALVRNSLIRSFLFRCTSVPTELGEIKSRMAGSSYKRGDKQGIFVLVLPPPLVVWGALAGRGGVGRGGVVVDVDIVCRLLGPVKPEVEDKVEDIWSIGSSTIEDVGDRGRFFS